MNGTGNLRRNSANSVPRYWLIDRFGNPFGWFNSALEAAEAAKRLWPDQEQDEGREAGTGWDIEVQP